MAKSKGGVSETKKSDKPSSAKNSEKKSKKKGSAVAKYFRDLRSEFKKVVWPTKKQVANNTLVVLGTMAAAGLFVFALDSGMYKLLQLLMSVNNG